MLHLPTRRSIAPVISAALAMLLLPGVAAGHAELETPTPADKSTSTQPVTAVSGVFTQRVKVDGSRLVVKLVGGGTVAQGGVDPSDVRKMVATPVTPLGSGSYLVEWTTISLDDGELARGTWTFDVAVAPTPSATPIPTAAPTGVAATAAPTSGPTPVPPTAPPSAGATPVPSGGGDTTGSGGDVVLPIVVALILLGAGAAYLLTRSRRPSGAA